MMSLLFNMLLRFVIAFLPSSKRLLILGLQSLFPVVLESKKIKSPSLFPFFPYLPKSNGTCISISVTFWEEEKLGDRSQIRGRQESRAGGETLRGTGGGSVGLRDLCSVVIVTVVMVTQPRTSVQTQGLRLHALRGGFDVDR